MFSDSAVVSWPPVCSYATDGWVLEACPDGSDSTDDPFKCETVTLNGESPVHLPNLKPCKLYRFRLKARGDLLWTFAAARTLPTPQIEAKPRTNSIKLTIEQDGDCDDKALVHFWRVSHCAETESDSEGGSGVGPEYYYYDDDDDVSHKTTSTCVNNLHKLSSRRGEVLIDGLKEVHPVFTGCESG